MFGIYNGFVSKARVSACMYFLVNSGEASPHFGHTMQIFPCK
jgi:hypothetical protein